MFPKGPTKALKRQFVIGTKVTISDNVMIANTNITKRSKLGNRK